MAGTFINDKNFATDTLTCDKISSDPAKGTSSVSIVGPQITGTSTIGNGCTLTTPVLTTPTINDPVLQNTTSGAPTVKLGSASPITGRAVSYVYSYFPTAGTPWLIPATANTIQLMDQVTIPANTVTAGHVLKIKTYGIHTQAGTTVCTQDIRIGVTAGAYQTTVSTGTVIGSFVADIASVPFSMDVDIFCQAAATLSRAYARSNEGATAELVPTDTSLTTDWTAAQRITLTQKNATSTEDASVYGWTIQLI